MPRLRHLCPALAGAPGCGIEERPPQQSPCCLRPGREVLCQRAALPCPGIVPVSPAPLTVRLTGKCKLKALPVVLALLTAVCGGGVHVLSPLRPPALSSTALPVLAGSDGQQAVIRQRHRQQRRCRRRSARAGFHGSLCAAVPGRGLRGPLPALGDRRNLPGLRRRCDRLGAARAPVW